MIYQAGITGSRHIGSGGSQDESYIRGDGRFSVCVLCDGVSSCEKGKRGAEITARTAGNMLLKKADAFMEIGGKETAEYVISQVRYELLKCVSYNGEALERFTEYACTLSAVLYDWREKRLVYLNLGDGLILAIYRDRYDFLAEPDLQADNRCVTVVTENGIQRANAGVIDAGKFDGVLLCTDGAWQEMWDSHAMRPQVLRSLTNREPETLEDFLKTCRARDDSSFIFFGFDET